MRRGAIRSWDQIYTFRGWTKFGWVCCWLLDPPHLTYLRIRPQQGVFWQRVLCQVYPLQNTPSHTQAQSGSGLFWCLRGLCGNWAWLCTGRYWSVTSCSGYSHQCQLKGSSNRRRADLQGQLCDTHTQTHRHTDTHTQDLHGIWQQPYMQHAFRPNWPSLQWEACTATDNYYYCDSFLSFPLL